MKIDLFSFSVRLLSDAVNHSIINHFSESEVCWDDVVCQTIDNIWCKHNDRIRYRMWMKQKWTNTDAHNHWIAESDTWLSLTLFWMCFLLSPSLFLAIFRSFICSTYFTTWVHFSPINRNRCGSLSKPVHKQGFICCI